ncbi:MAG: glycosyltransferase, partial [Pseudolabrys sp.]|nr:glycosyltransferase [Pseudolabrys sp.]
MPTPSEKSGRCLLTILIPVFNGEKYLDSLLKQFVRYYATKPDFFAGEKVEILVVNNLSTDGTQAVAETIAPQLPMLRVINADTHVPTAEQNVFRSFNWCNGEYTWVLGVDDIPCFASFSAIADILASRKYDFLQFNNLLIDEKMHTKSLPTPLLLKNELTETTVVQLVSRCGFWFILAGMSGQVLRTDKVRDYDFERLLRSTSIIYSHVTAYIEQYAAGRTALVNLPLVHYKITYRDISHWRNAAATLGVFDEFFWTTGFIRQISYLENKGIIGTSFL